MQENSALGRALEVVRDLRKRCPWDRAQTRETLRPYLVEEVLELDAALREEDSTAIRDEMADFLLHIAWQFVIAEERGEFTPEEIAAELELKMRRRHPHLFDIGPPEPWERLKRREGRSGIFEGLPPTLPPLMMANRIQQRAAAIGFDWPDTSGPTDKVREELSEVEQHLQSSRTDELMDEVGDLFFAVVNLARKADVDPGLALDRANRKFRHRVAEVERLASERNINLESAGLEELDVLWREVKKQGIGSGE